MTVYVDDMLREATVRNGDHTVRGIWSHLLADTKSELLDFADHLGLSRTWIQKPNSPLEHFDITGMKLYTTTSIPAAPRRWSDAAAPRKELEARAVRGFDWGRRG